jgi:rhodanese-related sulfurtransferase
VFALIRNSVFLCLMLSAYSLHASSGKIPEVGIEDIKVGEGLEALPYSVVEIHYTGKLDNGSVFDSSIERGQPIKFTLGAGQVIPGWDMGIEGMRAKGKRMLKIPSQLAYGKRGAGDVIPPNADLTFDVELVSVTPPPFTNISNAELQARLKQGTKIIDIRRPEEWKQTGVVDGSIKLTAFDGQGRFIKSFPEKLQTLIKPEENFIVICRTGSRTAALSNWLATDGGYPGVMNVQQGITSWIRQGLPVNKSVN